MKALIFEQKVVDVAAQEFPVNKNFIWIDADVDTEIGDSYDDVGKQFIKIPPKTLTNEEKRRNEMPSAQEQLEMQYDDLINGTTTWRDAMAALYVKYPEPV